MSSFATRVVSSSECTDHERELPTKAHILVGAPLKARVDSLADHKCPVTITVWL